MNGRVIIMGSGETSSGLLGTHRRGLEAAGTDRVLILDTPFGFQANVKQLTDKLVTFFRESAGATADVATLTRRDADSASVARFIAAVSGARYVFAGPGSPSYALEIWRAAETTPALRDVVTAGGTVAFSSAASLTLGRWTIPVYEIYKVGHEPTWLPGLDLMTDLGLPCVVVPHWNNAEGGTHDTSRCYIGEERLSHLEEQLDVGIIGVDEHTAAVIDFEASTLRCEGLGTVTLRAERVHRIEAGSTISLDEARSILGAPQAQPLPPSQVPSQVDPEDLLTRLLVAEDAAKSDQEARRAFRTELVGLAKLAERGMRKPEDLVAGYIDVLIDLRETARESDDYDRADFIRSELDRLGVEVRDRHTTTDWQLR